jgi:uncharacterized surface protein with fasciclin (FAS1) repeats
MIKMIRLALLAVVLLYAGCKKDRGYYDYQNQLKKYDGNTYDFLKTQQQYDSFLLAIDRVQLTDSIRSGVYTVFAPSDASFKQAIDNMNTLRTIQGRALMNIGTVPYEQLDSLVCRYIVRGKVLSDSMQLQDGINLPAIRYGYTMHGKLNRTDAEGNVKGGPGVITYSDTKEVIYTNRWSNASTVAIDISTNNGLVNILEKDHMFGFDEFIPRMNPTTSSPWNADAFFIPGSIGLEQYNRGGNRVAYLDFSGGNYGGQYRPAEEVDVTTADEGGFKVGWTETGEWMLYSVDIMETGNYGMTLRYGSGGDNGRMHIELDNNVVIGSMLILPATGGYATYKDVTATVQLTVGKHLLKVYYDFANYDFRFLKFVPVNRPLPIPGVITLEDYDAGGEGVGYHDNDAGNAGGRWRPSEGVDIDFSHNEGGGYQVGWTNDGEWMNYTVDVKETGFYTAATLMGTPNDGKKFHIEFDGQNVSGIVNVPNTSDYHRRQYAIATVYLTKGIHVMRFFEDTGGYDVKSVTFKPLN